MCPDNWAAATESEQTELTANSKFRAERPFETWNPGALTSLVPNQMSLMWSQMALAADMALESFLALMTAAPRCCTVCGKEETGL